MNTRASQLPLPSHVRRIAFLTFTLALALGGVGATRVADSRVGQKGASKAPVMAKPTMLVAVSDLTAKPQAAKPQTMELMRDIPADEPATVTLASYSPITPRIPRETKQANNVIWMEVTAYCACTHCCGPNAVGLTASGKHVSYNDSRFVAADTDVLPFGTKLSIPGYASDQPVEVIDRGGAIKGNKLDVFFPTHEQALEWGRQWVAVTVNR